MVHPPQDALLQCYQQQCNAAWHLQYTTLLLTVISTTNHMYMDISFEK
jgi:hypothetical protein